MHFAIDFSSSCYSSPRTLSFTLLDKFTSPHERWKRERGRVEVVEGVKSAGNIVIMMSEIDFSRAFLLPHSFILFKWTVLNWGIWNDFFFCYANAVVIMQSRESILESENEENEEREEENWGFSRRHRIERKFFILKIQLF